MERESEEGKSIRDAARPEGKKSGAGPPDQRRRVFGEALQRSRRRFF